jgi:hypothetical protein
MKSNRGGARKGAGRKPGSSGKKIDKNIALTSDVWAFLVRDGGTAGSAIESHYRKTAAFKTWMKNQVSE